jgi:protein-disulfide isomerase
LALVVALLATACAKSDAPADPALPACSTLESVDDRLGEHVRDVDGRYVVDVLPDDPSKGAAEPLVVIVEYSDFQCPYCGQFAAALDELVAAYPEDVRIVFKQFPLDMHPGAEPGARAALAARAQNKFWAMHDRLFANRSKMERGDLVDHAEALGLDVAAFERALDDGTTAARVVADKRSGMQNAVRGTPSFFVNGRSYSGMLPADELTKVVEEERALGRDLVDKGSTRAEVYGRIMRAVARARALEIPPPT